MPTNELSPLVIQSDSWQVGVVPQTGASIAFGRVCKDRKNDKKNNQWLDFFRPTPAEMYHSSSAFGSFVMLPWSNRIRDAKFGFRGKDYQLVPSFNDGTAIHGVVRKLPWILETLEPHRVLVSFASESAENINFPWRFSAKMEFAVKGNTFTCTTWIQNEDKEAFPAGFGHHPYFMRSLNGSTENVHLEIPCERQFLLENCLPTGTIQAVEPRVDYRQMRELDRVAVDDCLTDRHMDRPIRFYYPSEDIKINLYADPLFENVVFYTPLNQPFFAIEPATNANDGFNMLEKGIHPAGVFILEPNEIKSASFKLTLE